MYPWITKDYSMEFSVFHTYASTYDMRRLQRPQSLKIIEICPRRLILYAGILKSTLHMLASLQLEV